ncbi:unnamed protein product, partial [marine sediment metagenome]
HKANRIGEGSGRLRSLDCSRISDIQNLLQIPCVLNSGAIPIRLLHIAGI